VRGPEKDLEYELASARRDLACPRAGYCNIPSIWPYMGVRVIPFAYGCKIKTIPSHHSCLSADAGGKVWGTPWVDWPKYAGILLLT